VDNSAPPEFGNTTAHYIEGLRRGNARSANRRKGNHA